MWGRWARSSALLVVTTLSSASLSGCYTVTEIQPRELPKLDLHQEGHPPVYVHTVDGDKVPIEGDFKEARILVGNEWTGREIVLRPPFRADSHAGDIFILRHGWVTRLDPDRISRVEVVQRDGGSTWLLVGVGVVVLAGLFVFTPRAVHAGPN